jgi:hypothetical protein
LVREEILPQTSQAVRQEFKNLHDPRSSQPWEGKPEGDGRDENLLHAETRALEQVEPAVPRIEMQMSSVEEATVVSRESTQKNIPTDIEVSAVGQGSEEAAIRPEEIPHLKQEPARVPEVFQNVGTENERKGILKWETTLIQVSFHPYNPFGRLCSRRRISVERHDSEASCRQNGGQITGPAAEVKNSLAFPLQGKILEQERVATVRLGFEGIGRRVRPAFVIDLHTGAPAASLYGISDDLWRADRGPDKGELNR